MKNKKWTNWITAAVALLIITGGILGVGYWKGWFDRNNTDAANLQDVRGVVQIYRNGVCMNAENGTALRKDDRLVLQKGAGVTIALGEGKLFAQNQADITIEESACQNFRAKVENGQIMAHCENTVTLKTGEKTFTFQATTALLQTDTKTVQVFRGQVEGAMAGQTLFYETGKCETLEVADLSEETVMILCGFDGVTLCFTMEQFNQVEESKQQQMQAMVDAQAVATEPTTEPTAAPATEPTTAPTTAPTAATTEPTTKPTTAPTMEPTTVPTTAPTTAPTTKPTTAPTTTATTATTAPGTTNTTAPQSTKEVVEEEPAPPQQQTCTIAIYCNTILNNMDKLDPAKVEFVPSSGVILYPVTVQFTPGETVFDVLKRVCSATGVSLEYSWTPLYNSYYVEGINQLYEFDCGFESGWMYKVNGWYPNYGCSSYTLQDGDSIVWAYTCVGLGADLG